MRKSLGYSDNNANLHFLRPAHRTNQRRAHRLGLAEKDNYSLTATTSRSALHRCAIAGSGVLPVVGYPDVARWSDSNIDLQLQPAANVAAGRRDRITGLHARRTVFGAETTELHNASRCTGKIGNPDVVVPVD